MADDSTALAATGGNATTTRSPIVMMHLSSLGHKVLRPFVTDLLGLPEHRHKVARAPPACGTVRLDPASWRGPLGANASHFHFLMDALAELAAMTGRKLFLPEVPYGVVIAPWEDHAPDPDRLRGRWQRRPCLVSAVLDGRLPA